jgi:uroporphyrinogen-III decarboxylase
MPMTGKQRLTAAMRGEPVDRAPIWLREGFPIGEPLPAADDFTQGWQQDPLYQDLYRDIEPYADAIRSWPLGGWDNRFLNIPPSAIHTITRETSSDAQGGESWFDAPHIASPLDTQRIEGYVDTPRGRLTYVNEIKRGHNTVWHVKPLVESLQELEMLAEVPFSIQPADLDQAVQGYQRAYDAVGDRGLVRTSLSSPIVCISACMPFQLFLELSLTEGRLFHELCQVVCERNLAIFEALFRGRTLDTVVNIGGAEQCTPPMMPPQAFDEYVVPYEGPMVAKLKEYDIMASCHCHGRIRHALPLLVRMGYDSTDPVEPPPAGDVTYAQARELAQGRITLMGNLEWDELALAQPDHIRARVREILALGSRRLIMAASAGPISAITPRVAENYRAWIEAAQE